MSTFVDASEATRLLGVTKPTLYAYVSRGLVSRRSAPDGRTSLYDRAELELLAARARRVPAAERPTIDVRITSAITHLDEDSLTYRGHDVAGLARDCTFEQVATLLWTGSLPDGPVAWPADRALATRIRASAEMAQVRDPIGVLLLALTVIADGHDGADRYDGAGDAPAVARRVIATAPSLFGSRRARGDVAERLTAAWHPRPHDALVTAVRRALVLLADHELATSTLGVRLAASVRADPATALGAGLQVVRGPLHGGASRAVVSLLRRTADVGARDAVREVRVAGQPLPGFGHAVYRRGDPRLAPLLDAVVAVPGAATRVTAIRELVAEAGRVGAGAPNVDLGLGALLFVGDLPLDAPVFAVARIAGWAAHYVEELTEHPVRFRGVTRPA